MSKTYYAPIWIILRPQCLVILAGVYPVPVDELLPDAARLPPEDEPGLHGEVHVGGVGEPDGEEGALGDGLGGVLE